MVETSQKEADTLTKIALYGTSEITRSMALAMLKRMCDLSEEHPVDSNSAENLEE